MADPTTETSPAAFTTFGALLRFLRHRARLTQRELSIEVGYNFAQISRLEAGQRLPDPSVVAAVFVPALDLDIEHPLAVRLVELAEAARNQSDTLREAGTATSPVASPLAVQQNNPVERVQLLMPLLITKLYVPHARSRHVARPHLLHQLSRALDAPVTVVSAPAGFGKTTLLADWINSLNIQSVPNTKPSPQNQAHRTQVAWLALDEGDNDPVTFLRYLVAAFQRVAPAVGQAALALAQSPQLPPMQMLVRVLLNDLAALSYKTVLVLDDYHAITTPMVHMALAEMLNHLPPLLHVVIATRTDPPLPLARWRARRQLVELRAPDLRFSADEAETFFTDVMGIPLSSNDVVALGTRTEGWIAGLQLAALAMRDRGDLEGFINAFTGSNRFVVDYLAAEVFERQPAHIQTFLLQTSILERFCGPLCDAVMGLTGEQGSSSALGPSSESYSQLVINQLEQANLFLIPLDNERHWYRYHHLFGQVLRERLKRGAKASDIRQLHQRASAWYESQELIEEAVQHALYAQDWEAAAHLLERHGLMMMLSGRMQRIRSWLEMLPVEVVETRPVLAYTQTGSLMITGDYGAAKRSIQVVEHAIHPDMPKDMVHLFQGAAAIAHSGVCHFLGDAGCSVRFAQIATELIPEHSDDAAAAMIITVTRPVISMFLSNAYKVTGDVTTSNEQLSIDTIKLTRSVGNWTTMLNGYTNLVHTQILQGRLHKAAATYAEAVGRLPSQFGVEAFAGGVSYFLLLGEIYREWNDLDAAEQALAKGIELATHSLAGEADMLFLGFVAMARVQFARGNAAAAFYRLNQFVELARARGYADMLIDRTHAARTRLQLAHNDHPAAEQWAEVTQCEPVGPATFDQEFGSLTLVRVRIAQGQAREVFPLLEQLLDDAEAKERVHSVIEILVLQALAWHASGEQHRALLALERALVLGEPEGYVRMFMDEGDAMLQLLEAALDHAIMPMYVAKLLQAFPHVTSNT